MKKKTKRDESLFESRILLLEEAISELIQIIQNEIIDYRGYKKTPIGVFQARDKAESAVWASDVQIRKRIRK